MNFDMISESLGTESPIIFDVDESLKYPVASLSEQSKEIKSAAKESVKTDYEFARNNLVRIIEEGMQLVPDACGVAREAETPRQFEALSTFLKTMADINKDLLELGERRIKLDGPTSTHSEDGKNIINQTNQTAVFCSSTEELFERLFDKSKKDLQVI